MNAARMLRSLPRAALSVSRPRPALTPGLFSSSRLTQDRPRWHHSGWTHTVEAQRPRLANLIKFSQPMRVRVRSVSTDAAATPTSDEGASHAGTPASAAKADLVQGLGYKDLSNLLLGWEFDEIRQWIEQDERVRMPYDEYLERCRGRGISEEDAERLADCLEVVGVVLNVKHPVRVLYLKPELVLRTVLSMVDPSQGYLKEKERACRQKEAKLAQLEEEYGEMDALAGREASIKLGLVGLVVSGQIGLMTYFTWWKYSWDLMEPITYMLTLTGGLTSLMYVNFTRGSGSDDVSLFHRFKKRSLKKRITASGFDVQRLKALKEKVEEERLWLKSFSV